MATKGETTSNKKKHDQLGMPLGTAAQRLRKIVLFSVLERHRENICFQCGEKIESSRELSIEHKKPWLNVSPDLFWDLDNIAFSHLSCNCAAGSRNATSAFLVSINPNQRKIGPEGTAWCRRHQDFSLVGNFGKNKHNWNGLQDDCKECRSKRKMFQKKDCPDNGQASVAIVQEEERRAVTPV
jgi:hypothetical protein